MISTMFPRLGSSKLVSTWILITLAASIIPVLGGDWLSGWLALAPARIWHGEVWRLGTWVFVEPGALSLILTCATIYKFGGELAPRWGDRRLRRFLIEVIGAAAVVTTLLALASSTVWHMSRLGGWVVSDVLVIAWARQYPDSTLVVYGLLRLRGRDLITVTIGITVVFALFTGPFVMAPELLACAAAFWYPGTRLTRRGGG
jgi:membrane associated rhomboid family serine protease